MKIAIHQPNFIPWRPFFDKMAQVDLFVVLTRCQFNREHYQHRFKFQDRWYTMGVKDVRHPDLICRRVYANPSEDWEKIKRRLPQHRPWFERFDDCIRDCLWATNYHIIVRMAAQLGIKTPIVLDPIINTTGTDRLVDICKAVDATAYLAGRSGASYMEPEKFAAAGIQLEYQTVSDTRHVFET